LLAFMNERLFHDHGARRKVALEMLFAATNDVPQSGELNAFLDRFLIRSWIENVPEDSEALGELIERGWSETYGAHDEVGDDGRLLQSLQSLRDDIERRTSAGSLAPDSGDDFRYGLLDAIHRARRIGASRMSNRRIVKLIDVMLLYRLYRQANGESDERTDFEFGRQEKELIELHFLDRKLEPSESALGRPYESMRAR
jgi:MoxR-like ATPase